MEYIQNTIAKAVRGTLDTLSSALADSKPAGLQATGGIAALAAMEGRGKIDDDEIRGEAPTTASQRQF